MFIMCVCLFSTLSRRVGALQIFIIIIINVPFKMYVALMFMFVSVCCDTAHAKAGMSTDFTDFMMPILVSVSVHSPDVFTQKPF